MSRLGVLVVASLLVLSGCSVPSLEELDASRGVRIKVEYTPGFTEGCIVIQTLDEANPVNFAEESISGPALAQKTPPLEWRVLRREGWSTKMRVVISAREQNCDGSVVTQSSVSVDLSGNGRKEGVTLYLLTPDADNDGFVAYGSGGTDCADDDPMRNPAQQEICDDKDNNCQGGVDENLPRVALFRDVDGDGTGLEAVQHCVPMGGRGYANVGGDCDDNDSAIAPGMFDLCDEKDNNCNGVVDGNHDKNWYEDVDGDGAVGATSLVIQCTQPDASYRHQAQGALFDCDDNDVNTTPGKQELCDNADNNCDGNVDELFPTKNTSCNLPSVSCSGRWVCRTDKAGVGCNAKPPRMFYPDRDGDGDGDLYATATAVCADVTPPQDSVADLHDDCDDVDPAASSLRVEVCDAIDNNCDSVVDNTATACAGTLKAVADYHLSSAAQDWRTVSAAPGGYPVWVAGMNGKLAMRRAANTKFESFSFGDPTVPPPAGTLPVHPNNCGDGDWFVSWVNSAGVVFLGGETGMLAIHTGGTSYTCDAGGASFPVSHITGMVGFESGGMTTIYVSDNSGRLIRWNVGRAPEFTELNVNSLKYVDIHGLSEDLLLVSGGRSGPPKQGFESYAGASTGQTASPIAHTANPNDVEGPANAVWMGTASSACAVGYGGAVWRWDGATTWNKVDSAGVTVEFTSVVMRQGAQSTANPLNGQCYMVDRSAAGKLRRLTPYGWAKGPDLPLASADKPLRDIAMTQATGEFWIVGDDGRVFHYPEP
ncbi:putative metal-binding motif-containing protein [Corallococcus terminator]